MTPSASPYFAPARAISGHALCCTGCDAIRDTERAFCSDCGEMTGSYLFTPEPDDGQIYGSPRFLTAIPHARHGYLIEEAA